MNQTITGKVSRSREKDKTLVRDTLGRVSPYKYRDNSQVTIAALSDTPVSP